MRKSLKAVPACLLILLALFFGPQCMAQSEMKKVMDKKITVKAGAIPPDFGKNPDEIFVCILVGNRKYDKQLKQAVTENYKGAVVFATKEELISKYDDDKIYRYLFYPTKTLVHADVEFKTYDFTILDKENDVTYNNNVYWPLQGKILDFYMQRLEEKRQNP